MIGQENAVSSVLGVRTRRLQQFLFRKRASIALTYHLFGVTLNDIFRRLTLEVLAHFSCAYFSKGRF